MLSIPETVTVASELSVVVLIKFQAPPPASANVLSPLKNVVESFVPVADKSANAIVPSVIFADVTILSSKSELVKGTAVGCLPI